MFFEFYYELIQRMIRTREDALQCLYVVAVFGGLAVWHLLWLQREKPLKARALALGVILCGCAVVGLMLWSFAQHH